MPHPVGGAIGVILSHCREKGIESRYVQTSS